jgi:hypothetical protein
MVRTHFFRWNKYEAKRPGKPVLIYIESSCSHRIWENCFGMGGEVGLPASFTSFTFFSGMVLSGWQTPTGREIYVLRKKKKRRETTINPTFAVASDANFLHISV